MAQNTLLVSSSRCPSSLHRPTWTSSLCRGWERKSANSPCGWVVIPSNISSASMRRHRRSMWIMRGAFSCAICTISRICNSLFFFQLWRNVILYFHIEAYVTVKWIHIPVNPDNFTNSTLYDTRGIYNPPPFCTVPHTSIIPYSPPPSSQHKIHYQAFFPLSPPSYSSSPAPPALEPTPWPWKSYPQTVVLLGETPSACVFAVLVLLGHPSFAPAGRWPICVVWCGNMTCFLVTNVTVEVATTLGVERFWCNYLVVRWGNECRIGLDSPFISLSSQIGSLNGSLNAVWGTTKSMTVINLKFRSSRSWYVVTWHLIPQHTPFNRHLQLTVTALIFIRQWKYNNSLDKKHN